MQYKQVKDIDGLECSSDGQFRYNGKSKNHKQSEERIKGVFGWQCRPICVCMCEQRQRNE